MPKPFTLHLGAQALHAHEGFNAAVVQPGRPGHADTPLGLKLGPQLKGRGQLGPQVVRLSLSHGHSAALSHQPKSGQRGVDNFDIALGIGLCIGIVAPEFTAQPQPRGLR